MIMNMKINGMLGVTIPEDKKVFTDKDPLVVVQSIEKYLNEAVFPKVLKAEGITMYIRLNTNDIRVG